MHERTAQYVICNLDCLELFYRLVSANCLCFFIYLKYIIYLGLTRITFLMVYINCSIDLIIFAAVKAYTWVHQYWDCFSHTNVVLLTVQWPYQSIAHNNITSSQDWHNHKKTTCARIHITDLGPRGRGVLLLCRIDFLWFYDLWLSLYKVAIKVVGGWIGGSLS